MSCKHKTTRYEWLVTSGAGSLPFARWCIACGERLDMGPANDEPDEVQVEIRAAELVNLMQERGNPWLSASVDEHCGWTLRSDGDEESWGMHTLTNMASNLPGERQRIRDGFAAGWLAHAIAFHDDEQWESAGYFIVPNALMREAAERGVDDGPIAVDPSAPPVVETAEDFPEPDIKASVDFLCMEDSDRTIGTPGNIELRDIHSDGEATEGFEPVEEP